MSGDVILAVYLCGNCNVQVERITESHIQWL